MCVGPSWPEKEAPRSPHVPQPQLPTAQPPWTEALGTQHPSGPGPGSLEPQSCSSAHPQRTPARVRSPAGSV